MSATVAHSYITHHQQQSVVVSVGFAATVALLGALAAVALAPALATRLLALPAAPCRLPTARTWRCRHQKNTWINMCKAAKMNSQAASVFGAAKMAPSASFLRELSVDYSSFF